MQNFAPALVAMVDAEQRWEMARDLQSWERAVWNLGRLYMDWGMLKLWEEVHLQRSRRLLAELQAVKVQVAQPTK